MSPRLGTKVFESLALLDSRLVDPPVYECVVDIDNRNDTRGHIDLFAAKTPRVARAKVPEQQRRAVLLQGNRLERPRHIIGVDMHPRSREVPVLGYLLPYEVSTQDKIIEERRQTVEAQVGAALDVLGKTLPKPCGDIRDEHELVRAGALHYHEFERRVQPAQPIVSLQHCELPLAPRRHVSPVGSVDVGLIMALMLFSGSGELQNTAKSSVHHRPVSRYLTPATTQ